MKVIKIGLFISCLFSSLVSQDNLNAGKDALKKQQYNLAITYFQNYQKTNPKNVEANYLLGEAYRQKGVIDSARMFVERALDFDDENENALASIVYIYGKLRMWDKAQKKYNEAMKYHKKSVKVPQLYADMFLETDSLDKASIYYSKIKENDDKNADAYIGLAEVYARQNVIVLAVDNLRTATQLRPDDASLHYKLASTILKNRSLNSQQIQEVTAELQKSIELDPKNENAIFDAANTFYRIKYWKEAAAFFDKYMQLKKDNPEVIEKYAISLYNAKAYIDAIPLLDQALKNKPDYFELQPMFAHSNYVAKEYKKAVELYKKIPLDSLDKDDVYRIGDSYFQTKDTVNAIQYFEKVLLLDKDYDRAIGNLAAIYVNKKKYEKAVKQYERLLEKDKNNMTALFYSGFSYFVLEKYELSKQYFKEFLAVRPNNVQARQYLGQVYSAQDSFDLASQQFAVIIQLSDSLLKAEPAKAAQHQTTLLGAYKMQALFSYKKQEISQAIENLLKAILYESKDKKDTGLHLFLAQMYAVKSGDKALSYEEGKAFKQKACQEYAIVLKLDPKNQAAKKESAQMKCGQ